MRDLGGEAIDDRAVRGLEFGVLAGGVVERAQERAVAREGLDAAGQPREQRLGEAAKCR